MGDDESGGYVGGVWESKGWMEGMCFLSALSEFCIVKDSSFFHPSFIPLLAFTQAVSSSPCLSLPKACIHNTMLTLTFPD